MYPEQPMVRSRDANNSPQGRQARRVIGFAEALQESRNIAGIWRDMLSNANMARPQLAWNNWNPVARIFVLDNSQFLRQSAGEFPVTPQPEFDRYRRHWSLITVDHALNFDMRARFELQISFLLVVSK